MLKDYATIGGRIKHWNESLEKVQMAGLLPDDYKVLDSLLSIQ